MSDTVIESSVVERKRTLASVAIALAAHVGALFLIAILASIGVAPVTPPQVTIDIQVGSAGGESGPMGASAPGEAGGPAAAAPIVSRTLAPPAGAGVGSGGSFVIPAPRGGGSDASAASRGPSFQEAGGKTGVAESLPAVQNQLPHPDVSVGPKGAGGSAAASSAGAVQRSGQGTPVQGRTGKGSAGSLDLSQLDKSLARGSGGGTGAGKGSSGTGQSGTGSGAGGSGSGGGTGSGGAGTGGSGSGGYRVVWDQAGTGRRLVEPVVQPKIPAWVSTQGLTLSVTVDFTLMPDGLIGAVALKQSSGYADVDSAVLDAIRRWRFTAAKGTVLVKGVIPYVVKPR
jgi:TonB family protein